MASRNPVMVLTADIHVHPHNYHNHYESSRLGSRVETTVKAMRQSLLAARQHDIPWWSLGDLIHTRDSVPIEVLNALQGLFLEFGDVTKHLIVGNHECRKEGINTLQWMTELPSTNVWTDVATEPVYPGWKVAILPSPATPERAAELEDADILLGHAGIKGAIADNGTKLGSGELSVSDLNLDRFKAAFFGDIHLHQAIADNAWYVGALTPQSYKDTQAPGFVVVYDDFSWERQGIVAPEFKYELGANEGFDVESGNYIRPTPMTRLKPELDDTVDAHTVTNLDIFSVEGMVEAWANEHPLPQGVTIEDVVSVLGPLIR